MNPLRIRPAVGEQEPRLDEQRVREFVDSGAGISESAHSLADKLGISQRRCRFILEGLVKEGIVERREFADMPPMYLRFPSR
ncbi:MAG: hypothetical protein JO352_23475 [Chloroflexi bacterium]|nr:hypothetical protein [Chloroflexota bacterium]MBV9598531.1 hypothetical protein [Chloroflexota bacterium]